MDPIFMFDLFQKVLLAWKKNNIFNPQKLYDKYFQNITVDKSCIKDKLTLIMNNFFNYYKDSIIQICKNDFNHQLNNKEYDYLVHGLTIWLINPVTDDIYKIAKQEQNNLMSSFKYTYEELKKKVSTLLSGYIYLHLDQSINNLKDDIEEYRNEHRTLREINNIVYYDIVDQYELTEQFCQEHFNISLEHMIKLLKTVRAAELINNNDKQELENDISKKIQSILNDINTNNKTYLINLDNDDKINQPYGSINYDPHDLDKRDGPILIYRDKEGKDHILIGDFGQHHIDIWPKDMPNPTHVCEAYYYKPCAFIENRFKGYTDSEIINLLKNDLRIMKVYRSPGPSGGILYRLAKNN